MPMVSVNPFISWVAFGLPKGQEVVVTLDRGIRGTPPGLRDARRRDRHLIRQFADVGVKYDEVVKVDVDTDLGAFV